MVFNVSMTLEQSARIRALDEKVCREVLGNQSKGGMHQTVFTCSCPFCKGKRREKKSGSASIHITGHIYVHPNGEGLAFSCAACQKKIFSVHQLLCELGKEALADWYATKRWECDRACGRGWTCPLPNKVKEAFQRKWEFDKKEKEAIQKIKNSKRSNPQ